MSSYERKAAVIDYWRACARIASWPAAPALCNDASASHCVRAEAMLPWESGESGPQPAGGFAVYCGVDGRGEIRQVIADTLGATATGPGGDAYLFSLNVDAAGTLLPGSIRLSPRAWVANCCRSPGPAAPNWLFGFEVADKVLSADVARRLSGADTRGTAAGSTGPIDYGALLSATRHMAGELGLPELSRGIEVRIAAVSVAPGGEEKVAGVARAMREKELSDVAADDLVLIAHKLRNLVVGLGLRNYLASPEEISGMQRVDIGATPLPLFQYLAPASFPPACWPVAEAAIPRLGEQFAVNSLLKSLQHGAGLFAVETLPGAGKTAVLRDLVAAVLVERACRLARLERPELAFTGERCWHANATSDSRNEIAPAHAAGPHTVSLWNKELRGFEMVLAAWDEEGVARGLAVFPEIDPALPEKEELQEARRGAQRIAARIDEPDLPQRLCTQLMADRLAPGAAAEAWRSAVASFRDAVAEERRLRSNRSMKFNDFVARGNALQEIDALEAKLAAVAIRTTAAQQDVDAALAAYALAVSDLEQIEELLQRHNAQRPGLMAIAFSLGDDLADWRVSGRSHTLGHVHAARRMAEAEIRLECRRRALSTLTQEQEELTARLAALHVRAAALKQAQGADKSEFGDRHPASIDWDDPAALIEQPTPWSDPAWRKARGRVFDEALRLHRVFAAANAERLSQNLMAAQAVMAEHPARSAPAEVAEAALASLFFVTPLLALKLSGFSTVFSRLQRESLGWMLLDEADRIPPRPAVNAIWRARRTVAFGDTIAPAATSPLPSGIHLALRRQFRIDAASLDDSATAQQLVARASRLGCWRKRCGHGDRPVWSGLPIAGWRATAQASAAAERSEGAGSASSAAAFPAAGEWIGV